MGLSSSTSVCVAVFIVYRLKISIGQIENKNVMKCFQQKQLRLK